MNRSRIARILLGLVFAVLARAPAPAHAADDKATLEMARERFKEGVSYFDRKQYAKARAAFLQAYALKPHPAVLLNLAQSELRAGYEADAAKHFSMFLREHSEATDTERKAAEEGLSIAKSSLHAWTIAVEQDNAEVTLDGDGVGRSPLPHPLFVTPGEHRVEARKDDAVANATLSAVAGGATTTQLSLVTPSPASVDPVPPPRAAMEPELDAGIELEPEPARRRPGFFSWMVKRPLALVGAGLTLVGVGTAVGFAIGASQRYDSADDIAAQIATEARERGLDTQGLCLDPPMLMPPENPTAFVEACAAYQDDIDAGDRFKTVSTVSVVVAGAAAAGTVVYYFLDPSHDDSTDAARAPARRSPLVVPWAAPSAGGILVAGTF